MKQQYIYIIMHAACTCLKEKKDAKEAFLLLLCKIIELSEAYGMSKPRYRNIFNELLNWHRKNQSSQDPFVVAVHYFIGTVHFKKINSGPKD